MTQLKVVSTELWKLKKGGFEVNGKFVKVSAERDPEQIDWANDGVEIVLEATGFFATKAAAEKHLHPGGAKKSCYHCSWWIRC